MTEERPPHYKAVTAESVKAHYAAMKLQPIEVMHAWMTKEQMTGFLLGNVLKYLGRFNLAVSGKGGLPDLLKAQDYFKQLIRLEESE
jgi:hypothetical protein